MTQQVSFDTGVKKKSLPIAGQELDIDAASFNPNGSERFWFERSMRWMIYASHEASITFGGEWLVEEVRQIFPLASRYLYTSYDQEF